MAIYYWCSDYNRWNDLVDIIKKGVHNMTIVVKKVPKALRGIVKFIFGIKE